MHLSDFYTDITMATASNPVDDEDYFTPLNDEEYSDQEFQYEIDTMNSTLDDPVSPLPILLVKLTTQFDGINFTLKELQALDNRPHITIECTSAQDESHPKTMSVPSDPPIPYDR